MRFTLYSLPAVIGAVVLLVVTLYSAKRDVRGARVFTILAGTIAVLLAGSAFATSTTAPELTFAVQRIPSNASALIPLLFLLFVAHFTSTRWLLSRPALVILIGITAAYLFIGSVEPWSRWITVFNSVSYDEGYPAISRTRGPYWLVYLVFSYCEVVLGLFLLVKTALTATPAFRRQLVTITIASIFPVATNLLFNSSVGPFRGYDLSGIGYGIFGLLASVALFRFRGLHASPVKQSELRASILAHMSDAVIALDSAGTVLDINSTAEQLLGVRLNEAFGRPVSVIAPILAGWADEHRPEWIVGFGEGMSAREFEVRTMNIFERENEPPGRLLMLRDVTVERQLQAELTRLAFQDSLTGLANRVFFVDQLEKAIAGRSPVAVLFLDLDGFKTVNDSLGHGEGDALLHSIAMRWRSLLEPNAILARFGGDEFVILISPVQSKSEAALVAANLLQSLTIPFRLSGRELRVTVSIGVTVDFDAQRPALDLLREADTAMYAAKRAGKARVEMYRPAMHEQALRRLGLGNDLREAIESGGLRITFTQALDPASGMLLGSETVVTWQHPERGTIEMEELFALAIDQGLALPLSRWMIHEGCRALGAWRSGRPGREHAIVRVTVPLLVILQPAFAGELADVLSELGIPPACLWLDVFDASTRIALSDMDSTSLEKLGIRLGGKLDAQVSHDAPLEQLTGPLTAREMDVSLLIAQGLSNNQIAEQLQLSPHTVSSYVKQILAKLNLQSRAQVAVYITRSGETPAPSGRYPSIH